MGDYHIIMIFLRRFLQLSVLQQLIKEKPPSASRRGAERHDMTSNLRRDRLHRLSQLQLPHPFGIVTNRIRSPSLARSAELRSVEVVR